MKRLVQLGLCLVVAATLHFASGDASAQDGCCGGYGDGFYYGFYRRNLQSDQMPPYFSQFPPVYYRFPIIARPYGWSPFAMRPRELDIIPPAPAEPVMIRNPYVDQPKKKTVGGEKTASKPLRIQNPFVGPGSSAQVASHPGQR